MYVFSKELRREDGSTIAKFSCHWAAVAAMIRISKPEFKSLNGDNEEDLRIEKEMKIQL